MDIPNGEDSRFKMSRFQRSPLEFLLCRLSQKIIGIKRMPLHLPAAHNITVLVLSHPSDCDTNTLNTSSLLLPRIHLLVGGYLCVCTVVLIRSRFTLVRRPPSNRRPFWSASSPFQSFTSQSISGRWAMHFDYSCNGYCVSLSSAGWVLAECIYHIDLGRLFGAKLRATCVTARWVAIVLWCWLSVNYDHFNGAKYVGFRRNQH